MVQWARENINRTGLPDAPVRWIVDDCKKFIEREQPQEETVIAVSSWIPPLMAVDPGRRIWKLEDSIDELVALAAGLLSEDAGVFFAQFLIQPGFLHRLWVNLLALHTRHHRGKTTAVEIGLPVTATGLVLPAGSQFVWISRQVVLKTPKLLLHHLMYYKKGQFIGKERTHHMKTSSMQG
jgi:23S rRNA (cytosine1962-C5)-methyltransferase